MSVEIGGGACQISARWGRGAVTLTHREPRYGCMVELEIKPTWSAQFRVAFVLLAGNVLLGVLCFLLFGGGADILARKAAIVGYVPDATGVAPSSEVRLSGIRIGTVNNVVISGLLDPLKSVRIDMKVTSRYLKSIPLDSLMSVDADTLVGYKFIDIKEGKSPASLAENGVLQSEPISDVLARSDLVGTLQQDLAALDQFVKDLSTTDTTFGRLLLGEAEYKVLLGRVRGFDESLHTFLTPDDTLGQALFSSKMYDELHSRVTGLDQSMEAIARGDGTAGRLYASDAQYEALVRQLANLRAMLSEANSGKGPLAKLLTKDEDWQRLKQLLRSADDTIRTLTKGRNTSNELLTNPQLYESLTGSLRSVTELLKQIREHPEAWQRYKVF